MERGVPELIEEGTNRGEALHSYRVHALRSFGVRLDQPRPLEHAKVLGDRGAADRKSMGQVHHGERSLPELDEDLTTNRVPKGIERVHLQPGGYDTRGPCATAARG